MEHPFFTTPRLEALRLLTTAEKLLAEHDLLGSKSFAARAYDCDPTLADADQIIAIVDTLLTGEQRIADNQPDWYAVLRLTPQKGGDAGLVTGQYRHLALLLNPQTNKFPYAEQAFRLVVNAYSILSNPSRRTLYDSELAFHSQPPPPQQHLPNKFVFFGGVRGVAEQLVHGGQCGGFGGSHSAQVDQVHVQPQVEHVVGRSTRQPQNFMGFSSGYDNVVFGSSSSYKSGYETVSNQERTIYLNSGVSRGVVSASRTNQEQFNVNVSGNVGEKFETIEVDEDVGVVEEEGNHEDEDEVRDGEYFGDEDDDDDDDDEEEEEEEEDEDDNHEEDEERAETPVVGDASTFWTACPYCYYLYEYPQVYVDWAMKCQNYKKAFHAVVIPSPPPIVEGQESYFCCWGLLPFGFSMEDWNKHNVGASDWAPFTPMFSCTQMGNNVNEGVGGARGKAPLVYDSNVAYVVISDSSESDENTQDVRVKYEGKKAKNVQGKKAIGTTSRRAKKTRVEKGVAATIIQDGAVSPQGAAELHKKSTSGLNKMGLATNAGKLDLNVEPAIRTSQLGRGEDDNIEGNGFFEGLEEYLNNLPILNDVGDDKVVKAEAP